jgi:hypothetical protein
MEKTQKVRATYTKRFNFKQSPCEEGCEGTSQWTTCEVTGFQCVAFRDYVDYNKYNRLTIGVSLRSE